MKQTINKKEMEVPEGWEMKRLEEIGSFLKGKGISKAELVESGKNAIRYGELYTVHNFFIKEFHSFISEETASNSFKVENGDVLFAGSGETAEEIGKSAAFISKEEAYAGGDIIVLRTNKEEVDSKFLGFQTNHDIFRKQTFKMAQGNAVVHIYPRNLSKIKLPLPPLSEQKAIAQVLTTADKNIALTDRLIEQKEKQKKWLMQMLLNEKLIIKNEKLCKSGIKRILLKEVAKVIMGQSPHSEAYNTESKGLPLIQGNADIENRRQIIRYWTKDSNKECDKNDIIMTVRAPVGAVGLALQKSSIGRGVCCIKPKLINHWYLYYLLIHKETAWKKFEQGSTFTAISSKDIFNFSFFIVNSFEEQTAIANILQTADKEIELLKAKAEQLRMQKKGLMQVLLTGTLRLRSVSLTK